MTGPALRVAGEAYWATCAECGWRSPQPRWLPVHADEDVSAHNNVVHEGEDHE